MRAIDCFYCERPKCECGGERKITQGGDRPGEVRVRCSKCGTEWTHWHVVRGKKLRGRARP